MKNKSLTWHLLDLFRGSNLEEGSKNILVGSCLAIEKNDPLALMKLAQSKNLLADVASEFERIESPYFTEQVKLYVTKIILNVEQHFSVQSFSLVISQLMNIREEELSSFYNEFLKFHIDNSYVNTPSLHEDINEIISEVLSESAPISFYDGTAGEGFTAAAFAQKNPSAQLLLQEINKDQATILTIKMFLENRKAKVVCGNTVTSPAYKDDNNLVTVDAAVVDAPLALKFFDKEEQVLEHDIYNRNFFGKPSKSQGTMFFVNNALAHLNSKGKMVAVFSPAMLARSGADKKIRENYMKFDLIEAIIQLPEGLMVPYTNVGYTLVVFNKNKPTERKRKILMVNAANESVVGEKRAPKLEETTINRIKQVLSRYEEMETFSKILSLEEIQDGNLDPARYVFKSEVVTDEFGLVSLDLEGFKELETIKLGDLVTSFMGYNALPKDVAIDGAYAVLKITDVVDGEIDESNLTRYKVPTRSKAANSLLQTGDIVISIRGANRKVAVFESDAEDIVISQNFLGLRCNESVDPYFLKLYLESPIAQFYFDAQSLGSTVVTLPRKAILDLDVPNLPLEVQQEVGQNYKDENVAINAELKRLEARKKELKLEAFERMCINRVMDFK